MTSVLFRTFLARAGLKTGLVIALASLGAVAADAGGRPASFVVDANTGTVLSAQNADEPRFPASLTKMMTLYIAFDLMQQGRLHENTRIKISDTAAAAQPTKLALPPDSDIALIDAVKSLVTLSANDIAIAIAEHIAGSEERFAALMTQKARALGMKTTTFKNASGLPNSEQVTTARDMVTLGLRLHDDFPKHYALFAMRDFRYAGRNHANHNTMLNNYEGTEGIKTGYTQASGFNLVASVKRGSKHVVGAVFGGVTASSRNATMRTLLNMAFYKASSVKTRAPASLVARTRQAPEPKLEARPQTQIAAANTPATTPAEWPAFTTPSPVLSPSTATQPIVQVELARVRPVLVAPRAARTADPLVASDTTAAPTPPQPIRLASASPAATAPTDYRLPPITSAASTEAASPRALAATPGPNRPFTQPLMAVGNTPAAPTAPAAATTSALARGNPPSSFQQQAANLVATPTNRMPAIDPRAPLAAAQPAVSATSVVDIQIGAYATVAEAERQLSTVRGTAPDLIGNAQARTQPTTANGKSLWRARFAGFQASTAGSVCTELRRRQIDCLVAKPE